MFSYYGSKGKVVHCYPAPIHDKIIEPFAGSARYALRYWYKDVLLVDKYDVVIRIWKWLQQCSPQDILGLPIIKKGESLNDFNLSEEEKMFIGFLINIGGSAPCLTCTDFGDTYYAKYLSRISKIMGRINYWVIQLGDYQDIPNQEATWFIDAPYQVGGNYYRFNEIDYVYLKEYCKSRIGQVIVCENNNATWWDFVPMKKMQGRRHTTTECIWTNFKTNYHYRQQELFEGA